MRFVGLNFDKKVGQADTTWPDLRLGQTYGWGTEIYRTGRRKRQKETGMKISKAIRIKWYTGPSCDKTCSIVKICVVSCVGAAG